MTKTFFIYWANIGDSVDEPSLEGEYHEVIETELDNPAEILRVFIESKSIELGIDPVDMRVRAFNALPESDNDDD